MPNRAPKPTLADTLIPEFNWSPAAGQALIRDWKLNKKRANPGTALMPGNLLFIQEYNASTVKVYDQNPVVMVLNTSKKHVLCFNINWLGKRDRERMLRQFIKHQQGRKGKNPMGRLERLMLFNKIRKFRFPRDAYRLYYRNELRKSRIYNLTMGDFYKALTRRLITKIKLKR